MSLLNNPAPPLEVDRWVQGDPPALDACRGRVVLIEVFQVNCPGCFVGGLPEAIDIFLKNRDQPLVVWGLATAFEDYRLNSLENLVKLLETGEVVGETHRHLAEMDMLSMDRLQYFIPFAVAWDRITRRDGEVTQEEANDLIHRDFPMFDDMPEPNRIWVREQVTTYLKQKEYSAATFDRYQLKGTPSSILIDKKGVLRETVFGSGQGLEGKVQQLLKE